MYLLLNANYNPEKVIDNSNKLSLSDYEIMEHQEITVEDIDNYNNNCVEQYKNSISQEQREFIEEKGNTEMNNFLAIADEAKQKGSKLKSALGYRRVQEWSVKKGYEPKVIDKKLYFENSKLVHDFSLKELKMLK